MSQIEFVVTLLTPSQAISLQFFTMNGNAPMALDRGSKRALDYEAWSCSMKLIKTTTFKCKGTMSTPEA